MASSPLAVPKFSVSQIALAHVCAESLWNGFFYDSNKPMKWSEEQYVQKFSTATQIILKNHNTVSQLNPNDLHDLVVAANLKMIYRNRNKTDLQQAVNTYPSSAVNYYSQWKSGSMNSLDPHVCATLAECDWGGKFIDPIAAASLRTTLRVPLASRVLFYGMPDLMVFNYSGGLAKAINIRSRTKPAIGVFNKIMSDGLVANKVLLNTLTPPSSSVINTDLWSTSTRSDWWQRRVLDLALLFHFNLSSASQKLHQDARTLAANWNAAQQSKVII
jgi:hypothetical protein